MNFNKKLRGFTLVEMLIVIVIIGVLAAALIPRLTSVRGRANDTARRVALTQLGEALSLYQMDFDKLPPMASGLSYQYLSNLSGTFAGTINPRPTQSNDAMKMSEYGNTYDYVYVQADRSITDDNKGIFLIARVETVGGANRVATSGAATNITGGTKTTEFKPCSGITKSSTFLAAQGGLCTYTGDEQLRYVFFR